MERLPWGPWWRRPLGPGRLILIGISQILLQVRSPAGLSRVWLEGFNPGGAGEIVEVVDTPLTLALGGDWIFDSSYASPFAFNVVNGEIVAADALYQRTTSDGLFQFVGFGLFGPGNEGVPVWSPAIYDGSSGLQGYPTVFGSGPVAVPGPLPIWGAAVAFGYGRRLRSRVRSARRQADVAPTVWFFGLGFNNPQIPSLPRLLRGFFVADFLYIRGVSVRHCHSIGPGSTHLLPWPRSIPRGRQRPAYPPIPRRGAGPACSPNRSPLKLPPA